MKYIIIFLLLIFPSVAFSQAPVANAGPDRTANVGEVILLDGTASTNAFDGWQSNGLHSIRWNFGISGFTGRGSLTYPIMYPIAGVFTVTLTVCNSIGECASDTAQITVNTITEGTTSTISDTGNPTTNGTNLCTEISNRISENNPVIIVQASVVYKMNCSLPNRTVTNYMTIRSGNISNLPNGSTRVFPTDASNMAIFESVDNASPIISDSSGGDYFRFIGIQWRKQNASVDYIGSAFLDIGTGTETSLAQLPSHIIVDRCYFNGGDATSTTGRRAIGIRGTDISVINSYIYRFKGVGLETQAIFIGMGQRIGIMNNYLQGASECILTGGADPSITNHIPEGIVIRRNHVERDIGWCATCGAYNGVNFSVKNMIENKIGRYVSIEGNFINIHWQEDQNWGVTVTVRNQDGGCNWCDISFYDFANNKFTKFGGAVQILGNDDLHISQTIDHIIFFNNVFAGSSFYNGQHNIFTITSAGGNGADRISIESNSMDNNGTSGQGRSIDFDVSTGFTNFRYNNNISQGYFTFNGSPGEFAFQSACSTNSYTVTKNGFYASQGTNPSGNSIVTAKSDVKYIDDTNSIWNLKLAGDSPFLTTGFNNGPSGADVDKVNTMISGTVTGVWSDIKKCNWHANPKCNQ